MTYYAETEYGFDFGAAKIIRCCSDEKKGWVVLLVETPRQQMEVYITKTGKVRLFQRVGGRTQEYKL